MRLTASPTTTTASPVRSAAAPSTASSVDTTVSCSGVVPRTVTDTASLALRPCSTSAAAVLPTSLAAPIRTSVPAEPARARQSVLSPMRAIVRGSPAATPA